MHDLLRAVDTKLRTERAQERGAGRKVALARLGYPLARSLQAHFRRDSARALKQAIAG